jgi:lipid-binding SYLF domain-containing protein
MPGGSPLSGTLYHPWSKLLMFLWYLFQYPFGLSIELVHWFSKAQVVDNMSTEEDPRFMESYLQHAMNVIDNAKHIPKVFFKEAKGVMLISAREGGFLVSNTSGTGVLVPHNKDGTWGMPMAVHLEGFGIGAVFGYANKDIIVIMNHFAMNRLLEGRGQTKLGVDMGFACGKLGGAVGVEAAISNKLGMGTSFIFSFSRGVLVDVEAF